MSGNMAPEALFSAAEVLQATGGRLAAGSPEAACSGVGSDSRTILPGEMFVALRGENFDGADFATAALEKGASLLMLEEAALAAGKAKGLDAPALIAVDDTREALGRLAAWHRRRSAATVVGITGSNGKTSTKQLAAAALGGEPQVLATEGNLNNQIGLPLCLLRLRRHHRFAVLEMGMNAPGEIARLAAIARPQVGVVTNVGPVHLEGLGSIENVARAKAELVQALGAEDTAVLNADDPLVWNMARSTLARVVTFGKSPTCQVRIVEARPAQDGGIEVRMQIESQNIQVRLGRPGLHNAWNAAAALAVAFSQALDLTAAAERLSVVEWPKLRMQLLPCEGGRLLVDCYNSNPRSLQAALETLIELGGGKNAWAVLGDMRELGQSSELLHRQAGYLAAQMGLSGMCAFGPQAALMARAAAQEGMADTLETESVDEAAAWVRQRLRRGAVVLVKGSRAMRLERVVEKLLPGFDKTAEG